MHTIKILAANFLIFCMTHLSAQTATVSFKVMGFYTGKNDLAHISFVQEANQWLSKAGQQYHFTYDSTSNWDNLTAAFLSQYQVVIFLDTRPDSVLQRQAFQQYMEKGGAWIGFHFAAFALTRSDYP